MSGKVDMEEKVVGMEEKEAMLRLFVEKAVAFGKKHQCEGTGYIHYQRSPAGFEGDNKAMIPILDNFLFAFALLRTRLSEQVMEARGLLDKLLYFQNRYPELPGYGNFPTYLHEYPHCSDRWQGVHVAQILALILKQFGSVLGQDLKKRMESCLASLLDYALQAHRDHLAKNIIATKLSATAICAGALLGDEELSCKGRELLLGLEQKLKSAAWYSPAALGSLISSLWMVYDEIGKSPWSCLLQHLANTWHPKMGCYVGPAAKLWQVGDEPLVSLYDYCLALLTASAAYGALQAEGSLLPQRFMREHPSLLESMLIPPSLDSLPQTKLNIDVMGDEDEELVWRCYREDGFAYSLLKTKDVAFQAGSEKGFHCLRLVFGDASKQYSFVCQPQGASLSGDAADIYAAADGKRVVISFDLKGSFKGDEREGAKEIAFFIEEALAQEFYVEGERASTFKLGERVIIKSSRCNISMLFSLKSGEGRFLGHRIKGNRPSQLSAKGTYRFEAFDWQFFLRTIERKGPCCLQVEIEIESNCS